MVKDWLPSYPLQELVQIPKPVQPTNWGLPETDSFDQEPRPQPGSCTSARGNDQLL